MLYNRLRYAVMYSEEHMLHHRRTIRTYAMATMFFLVMTLLFAVTERKLWVILITGALSVMNAFFFEDSRKDYTLCNKRHQIILTNLAEYDLKASANVQVVWEGSKWRFIDHRFL